MMEILTIVVSFASSFRVASAVADEVRPCKKGNSVQIMSVNEAMQTY